MFLSLVSLFLIGCDEENNDFIGSDNYLNSFSLEKDGTVYHAEIVNDIVTLTIPQDVDLQGADMHTMLAFRDYLTQHGIFATIRASRGEDIFAACGMLSTAEQQAEKKRNSIDV